MGGGPHPPLSVAMTWKANYTNPPSRGGTGIIVQEAILMSLCVIAVALRLYTRKFLARNLGLDDLLIVLALIPLGGFSAILILVWCFILALQLFLTDTPCSVHQIWLGQAHLEYPARATSLGEENNVRHGDRLSMGYGFHTSVDLAFLSAARRNSIARIQTNCLCSDRLCRAFLRCV